MEGRFFTKELIGKKIETVSGHTVGILSDFVIDTDTGSIKYLLVKPDGSVMTNSLKVDNVGRLVIETDRIRIELDRIVIN